MPSPAGAPAAVPTPPALPASAGRLTWLQVADRVLQEAGQPLRAADIVHRAAGLPHPTTGRTPAQTVARDLRAAVARGDARFAVVARGLFRSTTAPARPAPPTGTTAVAAVRPAPAVPRPRPRPATIDRAVLPIGPLAQAIESRGGLRACGLRYEPGDDPDHIRRVERLARAYLRARARGHIGIYIADELALGALGVHPAAIYGLDWFHPTVPGRAPAAPVAAATATG